MSAERSFEAWEEMQRHGQDIADRLAQGFSGFLHHTHMNPPAFAWPAPPKHKIFDVEFPVVTPPRVDPAVIHDGVTAIFDIGNKLGQAGVEFGAVLNGVVHQFFRRLLPPHAPLYPSKSGRNETYVRTEIAGRQLDDGSFEHSKDHIGLNPEGFSDYGYLEGGGDDDECGDEDTFGFNLKSLAHLGRSQGSINVTSIYDSRTNDIESSLVARGDLWRAEASHGGSSARNENSPLFLIQLGPVLFVRDTTLLLPVHLSSQHLLWYGFDRKNGIHSLCPAVWSKHRRWLLMSMFCLNPFTCSFLDLQFPNGQLTYVAGEGLTSSAFLPIFGGLLQAQGQCPGETKFSFSYKNKWGACITPAIQWPDKSFSLGFVQDLAWQKSGLMVRPTIQISLCPTIGGSNPGLRAEVIHSVGEKLSVACGCSCTVYPTAFGTVSIGRSKCNGNVGNTGVVLKVETPLSNVGRPCFSVQINSGIEF